MTSDKDEAEAGQSAAKPEADAASDPAQTPPASNQELGDTTAHKRNRKTAALALGMALLMLGLGYASVPLYRMFCQITGYGGTTGVASEADAAELKPTGKKIDVRFYASTNNKLPWKFYPEAPKVTVDVGARNLAFFVAENLSDKPVTGRAIYNVTPEITGGFFKKIQCFCFNEQTLKPNEKVRMPVIFYIDPAMLTDPDASQVSEITLSYVFNPVETDGPANTDGPA